MIENLKKLSLWAGIVGWVTFIAGILSAISGLGFFIVGAVPGVLGAFIGWKLIQASKDAKAVVHNEGDIVSLEKMINSLAIYFQIRVIISIVAMIISVVGIVVFLITAWPYMTEILSTINR